MQKICGTVLLCFLFFLEGCASVPMATKFHTGDQKKMQAAKHWDILANDIAKKIKAVTVKNPELAAMSIYLETDDRSPFGDAFRSMLKYNLFKQGLTLTDNTYGSIHLKYESKLLHHNADRVAGDYVTAEALGPGAVLLGAGATLGIVAVSRALDYSTFAASQAALVGGAAGLGAAGLLEMAIASQYTSITNTEFIFSAEITYEQKIYDMYLDVYYINSEDAYQYVEQLNKTPYTSDTIMSGKNMRVVGDDANNIERKQ